MFSKITDMFSLSKANLAPIAAGVIGLGFLIYHLYSGSEPSPQLRKIMVLTDLEPDDRAALDVLASYFNENNIVLVGSTVMHAARKAALIRKQLNQLGLASVPVFQGTGGRPDSYKEINSTKAARSYQREGRGILTTEELDKLEKLPHTSLDLQKAIKRGLEASLDKSIEIALLAPPTDLVNVLVEFPELQKKIKHLHIMGGWAELQENGEAMCRTTYNWDMDLTASSQLMGMSQIPMTLYSSHVLKRAFPGGSMNRSNFPELIELMNKHHPSLKDAAHAKKSWNQHVMGAIPTLKPLIEPYADHQLTPADPAVIVGMINARLIANKRQVQITIDLNDETEKGCRVYVKEDPLSQISLVDELDLKVFREEMLAAYERF